MNIFVLVFTCHAVVVNSVFLRDVTQKLDYLSDKLSESCNYVKGLETQSNAVQDVSRDVDRIKIQIRGLQTNYSNTEPLDKEIKEEIEEVKVDMYLLQNNAYGILNRIDQLETKVKELEQEEPSEQALNDEDRKEIALLKNNLFLLDQKVSNLSPEVGKNENTLVVTKKVFKVENYLKHKEKDDNIGVYSDPFFHGRRDLAYKMRLSVEPGGDDAIDDHITVAIQLMPGEFDDLLEWPIPGSYEFRLLPQATTFTPLSCGGDFNKLPSFQKPGTSASYHEYHEPNNQPAGMLKRFSHSKAETYDYLRFNKIYVEAIVTTDSKYFVS